MASTVGLMPGFLALPADIILEITNHFDTPQDAIALILTSSSLYSLGHERSFWISILERTRTKSPIACAPFSDLSQYTLNTLKSLVLSWLRLQNRWNLPAPTATQPVTTVILPEPAEFVAIIQGTDIVLFHFLNTGTLVCWDLETNEPSAVSSIDTGGVISGVSEPCISHGNCSLALLTMQNHYPFATHRHVVTIRHENRKAVSFVGTSSELAGLSGPAFESCFLTAEIAGSVVVHDGQGECAVTVGKIDAVSNGGDFVASLKIHHVVHGDQDLSLCFTYKSHLYIVLEDGRSAHIQHIPPISSSPPHTTKSHHHSPFPTLAQQPATPLFAPFCFILPSTSFYGISACFVRVRWSDGLPTTAFTFLPNTLNGNNHNHNSASSPLAFLPGVTALVKGARVYQENMSLLWMDHGGFNVVVLMDVYGGQPSLMLIRYHRDSDNNSSTSTHILAVSSSINLKALEGVSVDETAGAVHLLQSNETDADTDPGGMVLRTLRYV